MESASEEAASPDQSTAGVFSDSQGAASDGQRWLLELPIGWFVAQETATQMLVVPIGSNRTPATPAFIVTAIRDVYSDEAARRRAPSLFADSMARWDFSGQPAVAKLSGTEWPAYEATRGGVERRSGNAHRVYVAHHYGPRFTLVGFGRCDDDEAADDMIEVFREMAMRLRPKP